MLPFLVLLFSSKSRSVKYKMGKSQSKQPEPEPAPKPAPQEVSNGFHFLEFHTNTALYGGATVIALIMVFLLLLYACWRVCPSRRSSSTPNQHQPQMVYMPMPMIQQQPMPAIAPAHAIADARHERAKPLAVEMEESNENGNRWSRVLN